MAESVTPSKPAQHDYAPWMNVARQELASGIREDEREWTIPFFPGNMCTPLGYQLKKDLTKNLAVALGPLKEQGIVITHDGITIHASSPGVEKYYTAVKVYGDVPGKRGVLVKNPSDEVAWCAAFVNWCLETSGVKGNESAGAASFMCWTGGLRLHSPLPGCIAVVPRPGGKHHVAFYVGRKRGKIVLLGGNQGDAVSESDKFSELGAAFVWPNYPPFSVPVQEEVDEFKNKPRQLEAAQRRASTA